MSSKAESSIKIMLIEDDEDDFIITRDLFTEIERSKYVLSWVDSYEAGRKAIQRGGEDVYLIDYRLGAQSGLELLKEAMELGFLAPIILLTGLGDREVEEVAMRSGAADYLVKGQITPALLDRSIVHSLQRKRIEQRLRHSEEQYRLLFDKSPYPMWVADANSLSFLAVNEAAIQHYGYAKEEFLKMSFRDMRCSDEPGIHSDTLSLPFSAEPPLKGIWKQKKSDGSIIHVEVTSSWIQFEGKPAALILGNDVTQRLELEARLRQSQKMESIGTLAGGIAHDFNNILGIISGYASYLRLPGLGIDQVEKSLDAISKAAERGAGLVKQILTFARRTETTLKPTDVNALIEELARMLGETFPKYVQFGLDLSQRLPPVVVDPSQLHQCLLNLCVNARDAMPNGGCLKISTHQVTGSMLRAKHAGVEDRDYICIGVSDTGIGMDEATRTRIFEPFFTTKGRDQGTGLGLAVVYGVIKNHSGFIDVESALGCGTQFRLYLPFPVSKQADAREFQMREEKLQGGSETVLLVEDEPSLLELMSSVLTGNGYEVIQARDGLEAVTLYSQNSGRIALVVADLDLPKLNGWEACREIRRLNSNAKIILASGYMEPEKRQTVFEDGISDFIQKPYMPRDILSKIRQALDGAK